jgi:predicted RNase H-like nuclease (RuvC/YqgF family)
MNGKEQRIAKLDAVQQQRKQDCLDRTEKAISKLLQNNERVSFGAIARIANVSVSYLYKYPEIKERVQDIRNQQVKNARQLTRPQTASEKSKQVMIQQLRERINTLEWEKKELKKQNEKMTGELYRIGTKLDLFDRINNQSIKQAEEIKLLKLELEQTRNELDVCKSKLIENNPKVTSISKKIQQSSNNQDVDSQLQTKLSEIGVKLNTTLKKIIESKTEQQINHALSAVKEYLASDKKVKSKPGLLRTALEENWTPNLTDEERQISQVTDTFSEWFKLAKDQGIVQASQSTTKGIIVLEPTGDWTPLEMMVEKGWTFEYLQKRTER